MQQYTFQKFTQEEILEGLRINDSKILAWLYQDQFPKLEKFVLANNGERQQAKDIFQEAFIVLWKNVKSGKFKPENGTAIQGYLYQVARHKWLDILRSSRYKNTVTLDTFQESQTDEHEDRESRIIEMETAFSALGDNCKKLLTRFYYKKESLSVIAAAFDWTEATARNNKYRCMQRLKEKIKGKLKIED
ncbi:RNA polymerase sigma factor, sigma-70 family [Cyclobacterium lianum]|uniref:RNA polymerase sigma factor, sigma-70 family n=1 Tax=Cyclobacterium lianum TaxID=388280 RepID=A0A1M7QQM7_9BACT|nr:sigma-70 family RNA polymerase sigma factor [Cyclobacterium lianum]SHN33903.1 RNA polymerase sigma factor, sigma-70 family [Cyclobacterium lianum]